MFGLGGIGLSVIQGAVMAKAGRIIAIDLNPTNSPWPPPGGDRPLNPAEIGGDVVEALKGDDQRRRRLLLPSASATSRSCGKPTECCHMGWGVSTIIGVAGAGQEIQTRPFQLVTGRTWKGTAFGGVKGRSQLPGYVENYLQGQIELDRMVTHTMPLEDINTAFDLMHEGKSIRSGHHFLGESRRWSTSKRSRNSAVG